MAKKLTKSARGETIDFDQPAVTAAQSAKSAKHEIEIPTPAPAVAPDDVIPSGHIPKVAVDDPEPAQTAPKKAKPAKED